MCVCAPRRRPRFWYQDLTESKRRERVAHAVAEMEKEEAESAKGLVVRLKGEKLQRARIAKRRRELEEGAGIPPAGGAGRRHREAGGAAHAGVPAGSFAETIGKFSSFFSAAVTGVSKVFSKLATPILGDATGGAGGYNPREVGVRPGLMLAPEGSSGVLSF